MPTTRFRTDADLDQCVTFLRDVHEQAGYPVNWPADPESWLTPPNALGCWVITSDDRVVGHVAITVDRPGHALVERLFVDPKETGAGLGRHLLAHCIAVAAADNLELSLEVADNCHAAIALYARTGWREAGRTPIGWGGELASELVRFESPAR